jgi:hypothetical protein
VNSSKNDTYLTIWLQVNNTPINIPMLESNVNTEMKKLTKQSKFIKQDKVAPIHLDYPINNVGLMLLVGKLGSGKTNYSLKHLLITNHLGPNGTPF